MQSLFEQLRRGDAPAEDGDQSELTLEDFDLASLRRIRVVADEFTTELDALNALHRDDFESADMYHRVRYVHAHRHSKLRKEHRRLLDRIGQGAYRHGMALGSDMERRQKKAEGVSDTAMIEIFKRDTEVASYHKAWDSNDFEKVVELASQRIEALTCPPSLYDYEGVKELCSNLQRPFGGLPCYETRLSGSRRSQASVRTETTGFHRHTEAHIAKNSDLEASHIGGLEIAAHKTKCSAGDALDDRAFKRQRQIREQPQTPSAGILSLSLELLLNISEWFDPADRIRLANTCRELRRVPHLWQQLVFKRIKQTLRVGWHRDTIEACVAAIETCQRRSHGTLTSVVLKGYILPDMLGPIFEALRSNPLSLQYLAIPTMQQELCYRELYRLCPNLLGVDIRINARHSSDGVLYCLVSRHSLGPSTSLFPSTPMPFKLRFFLSSAEFDCGDASPHMEGLEVVEGVSRSRQIQKSFVEKLVAAAPTLREWIDCPEARWDPLKVDPEILSGILPAEPIVFPRLRKLSAVWCEHLVVCECPSLEELSSNAQRVSAGTSVVRDPIVPAYRMLYHTPKLKKLHILLPSDKEARNEIFSAIYQLDQLEELYFWSRMEGLSLQTLIELQQSGGDLTTHSQIMWPALRTLGLMLSECPLYLSTGLERELCELLATRFLLHQGCRRGEARTRVAAALAAYGKTETKTLKAQKRKLAAEALAVAAESAYPGNFVTHEGVSREVFSPMLAELVTTEEHNFEQRAKPESDHMLNQLIVRHKALDVSHEFSSQRIFVEQ